MSDNFMESEIKYCESCKRVLPPKYKEALCPTCAEYAVFQKAKDFIRSGDYNEYDVAQFLQIPLQQVRKWIREGRIQYKEDSLNNITIQCQICGVPITFGTMCPKCLKAQNVSGSSSIHPAFDVGNMRHLQTANTDTPQKKNSQKK